MPTLDHRLYTWSGVFGSATSPIESWQFSLKAGSLGSLTAAEQDAQATALANAYAESWRATMPPWVILTGVTSVDVDASGKYDTRADGSYLRGEWAGSFDGLFGDTVKYPLQTALTISLTSARPGPTGKGRFFIPMPGAVLDAGHRISSGQVQGFADRAAEFIRDVNAAGQPVQIFSSKGYASIVTGVRVGRVPDTMRSRRGDMIESYLAAAV